MPDSINLPLSLVEAIRNQKLIPFVGAGVSMAVTDTNNLSLFPSWTKLLGSGAQRLRNELNNDYADLIEAQINVGRLIEAADVLKQQLGTYFTDWIKNEVNVPRQKVDDKSLDLARSLWQLGSSFIITTNYDRVLRWVCPQIEDLEEWSIYPTVANIDNLKTPTVWHIHGNLTTPQNIVLSTSDYEALYNGQERNHEAFRTVLRDVLAKKTLLFVGFSLSDEFVQRELQWLQLVFPMVGGKHFMLINKDRLEITKQQLSAFAAKLEFIPYDGHGEPLINAIQQIENIRGGEIKAFINPKPIVKLRLPISDYLEVALPLNGFVRSAESDRTVPIEQVWIMPRFLTDNGEEPFYKILAGRSIIVEAPAGYGKTTLCKFMMTIVARDYLGIPCPTGSSWQTSYLAVEPGEYPQIPLYLNIGDIKEWFDAIDLLKFVSPNLPLKDYSNVLKLLGEGLAVLLIDGLDEVNPLHIVAATELIMTARLQWPKCYFIVLTRPMNLSPLIESGFVRTQIADLNQSDVYRIVDSWMNVLFSKEDRGGIFLSKVRQEISRNYELKMFLNNPLAVTFLVWNYYLTGTLPANKASLYKSVCRWLMDSRGKRLDELRLDSSAIENMLEKIADYLVMNQISSVKVTELIDVLQGKSNTDNATIKQILLAEIKLENFLITRNADVSFWHLSLRDFFAARQLMLEYRAGNSSIQKNIYSLFWNPYYKEVMELFIGLMAIQYPLNLSKLLREFGNDQGEDWQDQIRKTALENRIIEIAIAHDYNIDKAYHIGVKEHFQEIMTQAESKLNIMSKTERVEVYTTLGALQLDQRITGRPYTRSLMIKTDCNIFMGKYPVTVQEYARFIREGGYEDSRWRGSFRNIFSENGWLIPLEWNTQKKVPNAPVVGISWHEATAYCNWLTSQANGEYIARLPSIEEWCLAAGNNYDKKSATLKPENLSKRMIGAEPIGLTPEHAGPMHHQDLHGKIWEWVGPLNTKSKRRRRLQISAYAEEQKLIPILHKANGIQRSPIVGFRVIFERQFSLKTT